MDYINNVVTEIAVISLMVINLKHIFPSLNLAKTNESIYNFFYIIPEGSQITYFIPVHCLNPK